MSRRTTKCYVTIFEFLKSKNPDFHPRIFHSDFERAFMNAVHLSLNCDCSDSNSKKTRVCGCLFHMCQVNYIKNINITFYSRTKHWFEIISFSRPFWVKQKSTVCALELITLKKILLATRSWKIFSLFHCYHWIKFKKESMSYTIL